MIKKLTEAHPLMKKYRLLEEFLTEQDLTLTHNGYGLCLESQNVVVSIRDMENGEGVEQLPYIVETKLILE